MENKEPNFSLTILKPRNLKLGCQDSWVLHKDSSGLHRVAFLSPLLAEYEQGIFLGTFNNGSCPLWAPFLKTKLVPRPRLLSQHMSHVLLGSEIQGINLREL